MSRTATANPKTPEEQFNALIKKVADLYGTAKFDRTADITRSLQERFEIAKKGHDADAFVSLVSDIFDERTNAIKECSITAKRLFDAKASPEKASVKKFMSQKTGTKKEENKQTVYLSRPSLTYSEELILDGLKAKDKLLMNRKRLESVMTNGTDLEDSKKQKLLGATSKNEPYKQALGRAAAIIHKGVSQLGKGIYSSTDVEDSQYVHEYNSQRSKLAADLSSRINVNHSNYSQLMGKIINKLDASSSQLDIASYDKMKELLMEEIKKDEEEYKKRMDKFDADNKKLAEDMINDMQGHADKSDERWKHRAMMLFLVFTPLGAFSIMGHVFNYLDPLKEIFGPIFEANKSLGEGFGDAITNRKYFGFLGEFMDIIEIDKAVEGVFELPIIEEFSDLFNVLKDSEIGQELMDELAPIISGSAPLVLTGIAATTALSQVAPELDLSKGSAKSEKKHSEALKKVFKELEPEITTGDGGKIEKFVDKKYQVLQEGNIDTRMCKFFLDNVGQPETSSLIEKAFKGFSDHLKDGKFDDKTGTPNLNTMLEFLKGDKASRAEARGNFLLLGAIDGGVINNGIRTKPAYEIEKEFDMFSDPSRKTKKATNQEAAKEKFDQNFYFDIARARTMTGYTLDKKGAAEIADIVKKEEVTSLKEDLTNIRRLPPSTRTSPKNFSILGLAQNHLSTP